MLSIQSGPSPHRHSSSRDRHPVGFRTADARLAQGELEAATLSALVNVYLESPGTHLSYLGVLDPSHRLELSSERETDVQLQVLYHVVVAVAARTSDHPAIVGLGAPRRHELDAAISNGVDLLEFGERREAACRLLAQRAISFADDKGTLRIASPENVTSLLLLEGLVEQHEDHELAARPYSAACSAHARFLIEETTPISIRKRMQDTRLGWISCLRDATTAATSGRAPTWINDDIALLRTEGGQPTIPLSDLNFRVHNPAVSFNTYFDSYHLEALALASDSARFLTGAAARRGKKMNLDFATEFIARNASLQNASREVVERLRIYRDWQLSDLGLNKDLVRKGVESDIRGLRMLRCALVFVLLGVVSKRMAITGARPRANQLGQSRASREERWYWEAMDTLKGTCRTLAFEAARELAHLLNEVLSAGGMWHDARGILTLLKKLPNWVVLLVEQPAMEEGGEIAEWTLGRKLEELSSVLRALRYAGWASVKLGRPSSWIATEVEQLRDFQRRVSNLASLVSENEPPAVKFESRSRRENSSPPQSNEGWFPSNTLDFKSILDGLA